jgi:hypothetical protein
MRAVSAYEPPSAIKIAGLGNDLKPRLDSQ